jgi:glycosyltransferase involved in cell wall biosynthesis
MTIRILAIGDLANNIVILRKYVKKSTIHLVNFPWEGKGTSIDVNEDVEFFNSLKTVEQVRTINDIKDNFDLCMVVSPAGARIAYLADLNYVWYFVGDAIRAPMFVKNVTDNLVLKQPYYNLNFLERRFYKWVYDNAVACVTWGPELFTHLQKYRKDGTRIDVLAVDTEIFNPDVKPLEQKKEKFTFFSPQRIGLPKGYDIIWKALSLCKSDFELHQVNWYDRKTPEEEQNSQRLLDAIPHQVKLIPMMNREKLAKYYAFSDAVIGQMRIGIGAAVEREAALCKKPVLQYSNPNMRYMIDGKSLSEPFLPKSQDPQELADLIDKIVESKEFREQLAEDEYNFVREMTDPDKAAAEWDDLFVDLSRNYKSIRKDSSPIVIKFRILFFVIANRLHIKKILKILKHN